MCTVGRDRWGHRSSMLKVRVPVWIYKCIINRVISARPRFAGCGVFAYVRTRVQAPPHTAPWLGILSAYGAHGRRWIHLFFFFLFFFQTRVEAEGLSIESALQKEGDKDLKRTSCVPLQHVTLSQNIICLSLLSLPLSFFPFLFGREKYKKETGCAGSIRCYYPAFQSYQLVRGETCHPTTTKESAIHPLPHSQVRHGLSGSKCRS